MQRTKGKPGRPRGNSVSDFVRRLIRRFPNMKTATIRKRAEKQFGKKRVVERYIHQLAYRIRKERQSEQG